MAEQGNNVYDHLYKELLKSEEKFRSLFNNSEVGMFITKLDGSEVIEFNEKYLQILKYSPEELKGNPSITLWANEYQRNEMVQILKEKGRVVDFECDLLTKDSEVIRCITSLKLNRETEILEGSIYDISERKRNEEALYKAIKKAEDSEAKYREYIDKSPEAIFIADGDGNYLDVNATACSILGFTRDEFLSLSVQKLNGMEVVENSLSNFQILKENGYVKSEISLGKKNGEILPCDLYAIKLSDGRYMAFCNDITSRRQAETELLHAKEKAERNEYKVRNMFENSHTVFIYSDKNGTIKEANQAALRMFDSPSFEATMQINLLTFKPLIEAGITADIKKCIDENRVIEGENVYTSNWGREVFMKYSLIPILVNNEIIGVWANIYDLTDSWKTHIELSKAKERAEESDRLKTAFLQNMSHEIRTPMNAIMGFAYLLKNNKYDEQKIEQYSDFIMQRSRDLLDIINDLLDISKIESGQLELLIQECNLIKLFNELHTSFIEYQNRIDKQQLQLKMCVNHDLEQLAILTDSVKLKQIFTNLVTNALKFTDVGTIEFGCLIDLNNKLLFYVKDTGIGIPADKHKTVFERFTQLNPGANKLVSGTGLGLSIVKGLLELMGGEIWLESEANKGSTFSFTIPFNHVDS